MSENPNEPAVEPTDPNPGGDPPPPEPSSDPTPNEPDPSLGAGGEGDDPTHTPAPTWPDDWRERMAGDDEEALKHLKRFKEPANVFKSWKSMRAKMDSGELRSAMPDPSDEEAMKAWREENGIPETPDAYWEGLEVEVEEADKPLVERYFADMHAAGVSPEQAKRGIDTYFQMKSELAEQQIEKDKEFQARAEDDLRAEWGPEFRANLNSMRNMLTMYAPEGLQETLFTARTADGTRLGDHPDLLKFLVNLNAELNPHGTVTPNAGETPIQTIENEISNIERVMKEDSRKYWGDEAMQNRYRDLLAMKDKYAA